MERSNRKSPLQMVPVLLREMGTQKCRFAGDFHFTPLHSLISGVRATATPLRAIGIAQAGHS